MKIENVIPFVPYFLAAAACLLVLWGIVSLLGAVFSRRTSGTLEVVSPKQIGAGGMGVSRTNSKLNLSFNILITLLLLIGLSVLLLPKQKEGFEAGQQFYLHPGSDQGNPVAARSPKQLYPVYDGPGSPHGFGANIIYTIEKHAVYKGETMAIVSSGAPGEDDVEIWSSIPDLVSLPDGAKFRLSKAKSWQEAFKVLTDL